MPSIPFTGSLSNGAGAAKAGQTFNKTGTTARTSSTSSQAPNYSAVAVTSPATTARTSNQQINDTLIAGTGPVGLSLAYSSGTAYNNLPHTFAKQINVGVWDVNLANRDSVHDKQLDRNIMTTGLNQLRDGRWANPTGIVNIPLPAATGFYGLTSAGDETTKNQFNGVAQDVNWRMGLTNVDTTLKLRTQ